MRISDWSSDVCSSDLPESASAERRNGRSTRERRAVGIAHMSLRCEIIPVTAFQQNCSLIWDDATMRGALVDAGGESERLLERAKHHGVTIEKMLVTHGHTDPASSVAEHPETL